MSWEPTRRALEAGAIDTALTLALEAWRQVRAPEIAGAIDVLDGQARATLALPKTRIKAEFQAAWLALAAEGGVTATGWLADTLGQRLHIATELYGILDESYAARKHAALLQRLEQLKARQPDPRIARAAVELLVAAPISVGDRLAAQLVYGGLLQLVTAAADVRALGPLETLLRKPRAKNVTTRQFLTLALPAAIETLRALGPRLDDAARAGWSALGQPRGETPSQSSALDGAALLAQIRARPDDDSLRLVYADWLLERGDPLGELIVLQDRDARGAATEEEQKRARALIRAHKDTWLGPLALVLRGVELERGFLAKAELAQNAAATEEMWRACAADERLATLRELRKGRSNFSHYSEFVMSPVARALTTIEVPESSLMESLLKAAHVPRLTHVRFARRPARALLERMAAHASLAELRLIEVPLKRARSQLDALLKDLAASGWLARLTELRLNAIDIYDRSALATYAADALAPHLGAMPPSLRVTVMSWDELVSELRA